MKVIPYQDLTVVGYNDRLDEAMVPTRVGPVYQLKGNVNGQSYLLCPPFEGHTDEGVIGGVPMTDAEAKVSDDVTLFGDDVSFEVKPGHTLWIDGDFTPHYEPAHEAMETLEQRAEELVGQARRELQQTKDPDRALLYAAKARAACGRYLNGYVATAALYQVKGETGKVALMRKMASRIANPETFDSAMEAFLQNYPEHEHKKPMRNVGKQRSRYPRTPPSIAEEKPLAA